MPATWEIRLKEREHEREIRILDGIRKFNRTVLSSKSLAPPSHAEFALFVPPAVSDYSPHEFIRPETITLTAFPFPLRVGKRRPTFWIYARTQEEADSLLMFAMVQHFANVS